MCEETRDIVEGSHLETLQMENYVSPSEQAWLAWVSRVERILGHSLDGDQDRDGYSLDYAYAAWEHGVEPAVYAAEIRSEPQYRGTQ